jgi:hypothetical protein
MKRKSYMIELDTDCDLNSDRLKEKYGERFFKSNERCVFWVISDDMHELLSDIEAETKNTKLEGLIEYFREVMWSGECDTSYGNYEIVLYTYRMPLEELQQNFNGFKKINEGM